VANITALSCICIGGAYPGANLIKLFTYSIYECSQ
jgi:hypothetical protein